MIFIYNIVVSFFPLVFRLAAFFGNEKAKKAIQGRKDLFHRLREKLASNERPVVWFHGSSLGELELGKPLIEKAQKSGEYFIVVSFFSPSGYDHFQPDSPDIIKTYLPFDKPSHSKKFLNIIGPQKAIILKNDLWFNFLKELENRSVERYLVSSSFRKNQFYFSVLGAFINKKLKSFDRIFVVDSDSSKLLTSHGFRNVMQSGDLRIDRCLQVKSYAYHNEKVHQFIGGKPVVLMGSSWQKEEELMRNLLDSEKDAFRVIIAPHDISATRIAAIQKNFKSSILLSQFTTASEQQNVLIIDQIGDLKFLYRYATVAVIGGAWGRGLHNVLEAVAYSVPIVFGPKYQRCPEAIELIQKGAAFSVSNQESYNQCIIDLMFNGLKRKKAKSAASHYLTENQGALERIAKVVFSSAKKDLN